MSKMKLIPTYRFDKYGYFCGITQSMQNVETGVMVLPDDCVAFPPGDDSLSWRLSIDRSCWQKVKSVAELDLDELMAFIDDAGATERNSMIKSRILTEAASNPDYQVLRDVQAGVIYVVKRPDNALLNELTRLRKRYMEALDNLKLQVVGAQLLEDAEQAAAYKQMYCELVQAESVNTIKSALNRYDDMVKSDGEHGLEEIDTAIDAKSVALLIEQENILKSDAREVFVTEMLAYKEALFGKQD